VHCSARASEIETSPSTKRAASASVSSHVDDPAAGGRLDLGDERVEPSQDRLEQRLLSGGEPGFGFLDAPVQPLTLGFERLGLELASAREQPIAARRGVGTGPFDRALELCARRAPGLGLQHDRLQIGGEQGRRHEGDEERGHGSIPSCSRMRARHVAAIASFSASVVSAC
jgi:hypothetical protein